MCKEFQRPYSKPVAEQYINDIVIEIKDDTWKRYRFHFLQSNLCPAFPKIRIGSLNLNHDALVQAYMAHYDGSGQVGYGMLPAFQGSMYQDGAALGDILRSFFRHVIPIVAPGAASFLS